MSPIAVFGMQTQMAVAREVILDPTDPRYEWALKILEIYGRSARRAIRAERGLAHEATAERARTAVGRRQRARVLAAEGWPVDAIRYQMAIELAEGDEMARHYPHRLYAQAREAKLTPLQDRDGYASSQR